MDHALAVVDSAPGGFDALTLAAVASRAGVAVPSLYKHVGSLADLRREVSLVAVRELTAALRAAMAGPSDEPPVGRLLRAMRHHAHARPGRYGATQVAPDPQDPDDAELRLAAAETVQVVADALVASGLGPEGGSVAPDGSGPTQARGLTEDREVAPDRELVHTVRTVRAAVHGFIALELGGGFGLPVDVDESFDHLVATLVAGLRSGQRAT
ncbi:MAG TPA: TetR/AcrR family transcriptional regulator [Actinotalea sp.]